MTAKPCLYCNCPTIFDPTIDKTFTKKDKTIGHGWWREDLTKLEHSRQRCDNFKASKEFMTEKSSIQNAQTNPNVQTAPSPLVKEMNVVDIAEKRLREETRVNLAVLRVIEDEVTKILGKDSNPARIGMYMKLIQDMNKK